MGFNSGVSRVNILSYFTGLMGFLKRQLIITGARTG
jgi:hypothetical protein